MTLDDRFERTVASWLVERAGEVEPGYLGEILVRTQGARQRPAWSSLERWLPVDTTLRLAPVPRVAWLLVVLALLLAAMVAVLALGSQPRLPEPFGPARNGTIVYAALGDVLVLDQATGDPKVLVGGAAQDIAPNFSRDGTRFVFGRQDGTSDRWSIMRADADGSDVVRLTDPLPGLFWWSWSPDGKRLVAVDESPSSFLIVDTESGEITPINLGMKADDVQWRPNGEELIFVRVPPDYGQGTYGLYVVKPDGTGLRPIAPPTDSGLDWQNPALSPDGTRIAYTSWSGDGHISVIDVTTGAISRPVFLGASGSDYFPVWSPDGSRFLFHRGRAQEWLRLVVAPVTGGPAIEVGPEMPWAPAASAEFSPDGTQVIARYDDGSVWLFDTSGGPGTPLPSSDAFLASWQRLAP